MGEQSGYTGRIHTRSIMKLPWVAKADWEYASIVMRQKHIADTSRMFIDSTTHLVDEYEALGPDHPQASENGNLQLESQICLMVRSYIGYFDDTDISIPVAVVDLVARIADFDNVVGHLDDRVVGHMLNILQHYETKLFEA